MNRPSMPVKWLRLPAAVCLIGVIPLLLLFGVDRIRGHQERYSVLIDSIMEMEIHTAAFHLQIEEIMAGDRRADAGSAVRDIDRAINLSDAIIVMLADSGKGSLLGPAEGPGLHTRALELKTGLNSLKFKALVAGEETIVASATDREFDAAYAQILEKATMLADTFKSARKENRRRIRELVLGIASAWTLAVFCATGGFLRIEIRRKEAEESLIKANGQLLLQAQELTVHRENLEEQVKVRTAELTATNDHLRVEIAERLLTEQSLMASEKRVRALSLQLLRAQEIERRRISMELHDELGQALNVVKLRVRSIEKRLGEEQGAAREDSEQLLDYLDEVIEAVRRLSLALSPAILEDLGLTAAIRSLVSDFARIRSVKVFSEIAEIDDLFPEIHRITIYRVVQEALSNAGRHAEAGNVSIVIRRQDDEVVFAVEDDGRGFDPAAPVPKEPSERGMGLTTMHERVRMMGGKFHLRSHCGEGTMIHFSVPVGNGKE